jgi:hypothetical protein
MKAHGSASAGFLHKWQCRVAATYSEALQGSIRFHRVPDNSDRHDTLFLDLCGN